jgi:hypothetical protein
MGGACGMYETEEKRIHDSGGEGTIRIHLGNLEEDGMIILKWILEGI